MARIHRWLRSLACCCRSQIADDDLPVEAQTKAMSKKKKSSKVRLMEMEEKLIRETELRESLQAQWEEERKGLMEEITNMAAECQSWREQLEEALMNVGIMKKKCAKAHRDRMWMKAVWGSHTSSVQKNEDYKSTLKLLMQDKVDMERKIQELMQHRGMEQKQYRRELESLQADLENVKSEAQKKEAEQEMVIKELKKEIEELKEVCDDHKSTAGSDSGLPGQPETKGGERNKKQVQGGDCVV